MDHWSYIYVISCGDFLKIGIAQDVKKRLAQIQTGNPYPCKVVHQERFVADFVKDLEREIHRLLGAHRHRGEWFVCTIEDAKGAIRTALKPIVRRRAEDYSREVFLQACREPDATGSAEILALLKRHPENDPRVTGDWT